MQASVRIVLIPIAVIVWLALPTIATSRIALNAGSGLVSAQGTNSAGPTLPSGVSSAIGSNNQITSYNLPVLRSDSGYNSVIHLANAVAGSVTYSVSFFNSDGTAASSPTTQNVNLGAWASRDIDLTATLGTGFVGSAVVTATGGISAAVDVLTSNGTITDNVDTYDGVATASTQLDFPLGFTAAGYDSVVYVQNPGSTAASVTLTFFQFGSQLTTTSFTIPAHGTSRLDAGTVSALFEWVGPIHVASNVPIVAAEELLGGGTYSLAVAGAAQAASTVFVPRFDYNPGVGWNSVAVVENVGPGTVSFTATFYNPNGTLAKVLTSDPKSTNQDWVLGLLPNVGQDPFLPAGFAGSVVITNSANSAVVPFALSAYIVNGSYTALASYPLLTVPRAGGSLNLPGLRSGLAGVTSAFTLINSQSSAQSYSIRFWSQDGSTVLETLSFPNVAPNSIAYASQLNDSALSGQAVSGEVVNVSGGPLPIASVGFFSGSFSPPTSPFFTPSATSTPPDTSTPTATPSPTMTGTATDSPTGSPPPTNSATNTGTNTPTPTITPTATERLPYGIVPNGISAYQGIPQGTTQFTLPLIRTMANSDSIIHVTNTTSAPTTATFHFRATDGTLIAPVSVPLAGFASAAIDVGLTVGTNLDGWATVDAATSIAVAVDIFNNVGTGNDNFDTYTGIPAGSNLIQVMGADGYHGFYSTIDVVNLESNPASVTFTLLTLPTPITTTLTVAPFAQGRLDLATLTNIPHAWAGAVQIQSDRSIAGVSEVTGNSSFGLFSAVPATSNSTFYIPRFDYKVLPNAWYSAIVLQNTGTQTDNYALTFRNPNGTIAATSTPFSAAPSVTLLESGVFPPAWGLPAGFYGNLTITDGSGNAAAVLLKFIFNNFIPQGLASYVPQSQPSHGQALFVPGLRRNAGTETTAFSIMNTDATAQSYTLTYRDMAGQIVESQTVTMPTLGSLYISQDLDLTLVPGYEYSVEIAPVAPGASLPVTAVDVYGTYLVPGLPTPVPTATSTNSSTPTVTSTDIPGPGTPSVTPTPTFTPIVADIYEANGGDNTASTAKPLVLSGSPQIRSLSPFGDYDWVSFSLTKIGRIQFTAKGGTCDTIMTLYASDGVTTLAMNDDASNGLTSELFYDFSATGTYYLSVRNYLSHPTGAAWIDPAATGQGQCGTYYLSGGTPTTTPTVTNTSTSSPTSSNTPTSTVTLTITQTPPASDTPASTSTDTIPEQPTGTSSPTSTLVDAPTDSPTLTPTAQSTTLETSTLTVTSASSMTQSPTVTATSPGTGPSSPTVSSTAQSTIAPTSTLSPTITPTSLPTIAIAMNGTSDYVAATDSQLAYDLPLVRTGSGHDTIIHVASAGSSTTRASVTFYNEGGTATRPAALQNVPLPVGGSFDIDAATYLASDFSGSAIVTADASAIAVSVDVINPLILLDSVDSYSAIPGGAKTAWVAGAKAGTFLTFDTSIHVQNTTGATANVVVSFEGSSATPINATIPPYGSLAPIDVAPIAGLKTGWVGAAKIVSDQPIVALAETTSSTGTGPTAVPQSYGTAPMFTTLQASSVIVPHFVNAFPGWSTALMLQNSGSIATFTLNFYNRDGSPAGTMAPVIQEGHSAIIGGLVFNLPPDVPQGFDGSVTITIDPSGNNWSILALDTFATEASSSSITAIGNYVAPLDLPTGSRVVAQALRKNLNGVSTTMTLINPSSTVQDYTVSYLDYSGHLVRSDVFSLAAHQTWTFNQLSDPGLPNSFEGSARIVNSSRGALPVVEVQTFGGTFVAPPQPLLTLPTPISAPVSIFLPLVLPSTELPSGW